MKDTLVLAKNMASKLKRLRIPGVIKVLDSVETDTSVIIAVEPSTPLTQTFEELSSDAKTWGLAHLLKTLGHIHKEAKCVLGNLNLGSVYVTESGEWALGGFELCTSIASDGPEEQRISMLAELLPGNSARSAPESAVRGGFSKPAYNLDSWLFGNLILQVFNGPNGTATARGKVPVSLFNLAKKNLLNDNPAQRAPLMRIVQNPTAMGVFRTGIDEISDPLKTISMATDYQFTEFLDTVDRAASSLPPQYLVNSVVPELAKCVGLNKGGVKGISTILGLSSLLSNEQYAKLIAPLIVTLYASPDRAIRMELLNKLPDYVDKLDAKIMAGKIYPPLVSGFSDTEPAIRENTVKSVAVIVDKLTDRIINGELLRLLARTQSDSVPEIRANTTILLGKIASKFSSSTRSGVLVAAYARALKDPFVSSRIAALMALSATSEYFSAQECAAKLVGALAPSLLDSDPSVRQQAGITMDILMKKIQAQAQLLNSSSSSENTNISSPVTTASATEWTSKLWGTVAKISSEPARTSSAPPVKPQQVAPVVPVSAASFSTPALNDTNNGDDGWGELVDDLDDMGWGDEEADNEPEQLSFDPKSEPIKKSAGFGGTSSISASTASSTTTTAGAKKAKPLKLNKPKAKKLVLEDTANDDSAWGWD